MSDNKIIEIIEKNKLAPAQAKPLLESFGDFFVQAHKLVAKASGIKVTQEDQILEMKQARELRLELRQLRIKANEARVMLKEGYLRGGNAVQSIYNDIEDIIKPEEQRLEKAEKFAEIKAAERKQARYEKRFAELSQYVTDVSIYQLKDISDEAYSKLLSDSKSVYDAKIEADKKAAEELKFQEHRQNVYRERRMKLLPLSRFTDLSKLTEDTTNSDFNNMVLEAEEAQKKYDAEQESIRKQNEQLKIQAEKDRQQKEAAELKLRQEKEAQEKIANEARQKVEAEKKAKEDAERRALLAPDKEKLLELASMIEKIQLPAVSSKEAGSVIRATEDMLIRVQSFIREKAKTL